MKRLFLVCLSIWALSELPDVAVAESDGDSIARTITESANAVTNFPQTKNYQKVFYYYTEDYSTILDGVVATRKVVEQAYRQLGEEMLKSGMPMTTIEKVSNIRALASGGMGWATYDAFFDVHSGEVAIQKGDLKCTGLVQKIGSEWKIQHEHCSSIRDHPRDK